METLEPRRMLSGESQAVALEADSTLPGGFAATINFQPASIGVVEATHPDFGRPYGERGNGLTYGWSRNLEDDGDMLIRNSERELPGLSFGGNIGNGPEGTPQDVDLRFDTLATVDAEDEWSIAVPEGTYAVALLAGDPTFEGATGTAQAIWSVNGKLVMDAEPLSVYPWGEALVYTQPVDGRITLRAENGSLQNSLLWVRVAQVTPQPTYEAGEAIDWETSDTLFSPVRRVEGGSVVIGNKLYVLGGYSSDYAEVHQRVDILDLETFEWSRGADLPGTQTHAGVAEDAAQGHIYWISGQFGTGTNGISFESTPAVWRYVVAEDRWERFVDLPEMRYGGAAAVVDDTLYYFGGDDTTRIIARGDSWKIDLSQDPVDTNDDGVPDSVAWERIATMPLPGDHLNASVLNGRIYITGGEYAHGVSYVQRAELQIYDPQSDSWSLGAPMPVPSSHNRSLIYDNRLWVFGGQREAQIVINDVRSYDPVLDTWRTHTGMPTFRKSGALFERDGLFYYVAGDAYQEGFPTSTFVGDLQEEE